MSVLKHLKKTLVIIRYYIQCTEQNKYDKRVKHIVRTLINIKIKALI